MFDLRNHVSGMSNFEKKYWTASEFGDLFETDKEPEVPANLPDLRGIVIIIGGKVEGDHAEDHVTIRSRTEFIVCLNVSPMR